MVQHLRQPEQFPDAPTSAPKTIFVQLDATTWFALQKLTTDGTNIDDAVRAAIFEASARRVEERHASENAALGATSKSNDFHAWVAQRAAAAPPLSACQVYVTS